MKLQCHLYEAYIRGGLQFTGIHERIEEWLPTCHGAHFDKMSDLTWINGKIYYHHVSFLSEEDLVAFKLTFAGFVST